MFSGITDGSHGTGDPFHERDKRDISPHRLAQRLAREALIAHATPSSPIAVAADARR
jgi:hypothetical protein